MYPERIWLYEKNFIAFHKQLIFATVFSTALSRKGKEREKVRTLRYKMTEGLFVSKRKKRHANHDLKMLKMKKYICSNIWKKPLTDYG